MTDIWLILTGVVIGVMVAAPVGPVNLICIRRTLRFGPVNGFLSGSGAAIGDGVFAAVAGFGISAIVDLILHYSLMLQLGGGIFLLALGIHTFNSHPHLEVNGDESQYSAIAKTMGTTFVLTITNPATMFGFIALFGGIAGFTPHKASIDTALTLVASVIAGSALWWLSLTLFVNLFRNKMNDHLLELLNKVSGGLIALFGIAILGRVLLKFLEISGVITL